MTQTKDRKINVIIATPLFPPELGDTAPYAYELAKRIKDTHKVSVVTYANHVEPIDGVRLKTIPKNKHTLIRLFLYTKTLIRLSRSADYVYLQKGVSSVLPALIAKWVTKTPLIYNYSDDEAYQRLSYPYPAIHQGQFRKIQKIPGAVWFIWHVQHAALRQADAVIAPSAFLCEELIRTHALNSKKVHTIYPPPQKMIRLPLAPFHKKHTVYVDTQLVAWKQVATAIRTVALLRESFPDVSLVIAGDGPERQVLEELIEEKTLERHVTLLGNVSKAERLHYLRSADVLFSPAMYEEKPDVLYEAMQYGVPIAASDVPGQREQLAHKKNALILPPGNALASSEALADLFENIALQKKLAQEAKELFEKTFSWNTHCEKLKAIFTRHEPKQ